jgi:putative endopeptidase
MKGLTLILATALMMTACANGDKQVPAIDKANFDESIVRNDDFYQWATGGWQKNNPLKPEYSRYGSFDVLRENNEIRINELFNEMSKTEAEFGSVEQKISDLYKMGLDEERLNAEGAEPIRQALNYILSINNREELIGKIRHYLRTKAEHSKGTDADLKALKDEIKEDVTHILFDATGHTPIVIPVINRV